MGLMEKIFGDLNAKEVKKIEKIVKRHLNQIHQMKLLKRIR